MNKSIIALAIAGAIAVPTIAQADATVFGGVRFEVIDKDGSDTYSDNTKMNIGVKGSSTMDNGLTAGYFIEFDGDDNGAGVTTDKSYAYVSGDFGKVLFGKTDNPSSDAIDRAKFLTMNDGELAIFDNDFRDGGVTYYSNDINGWSFSAGFGNVGDEDTTAGVDEYEDSYGASVSYDADNFGITLTAGKSSSPSTTQDGESHWALGGQYKFGAATIGAAYSDQDNVDRWTLGGDYVINKLTLAAEFVNRDSGSSVDETSFAVGATYDLGGKAYVAAEYVEFNDDAEDAGEADTFQLRYNVSF